MYSIERQYDSKLQVLLYGEKALVEVSLRIVLRVCSLDA